MKLRNRKHYNNTVRLPIILTILAVGSLVGTRWMNEVRTQHLAQRLASESRDIEHDIVELRGHIKDLRGRASEMLTRDAVNVVFKAEGKPMQEIKAGGAISITAVLQAMPVQDVAQNTAPRAVQNSAPTPGQE